MKPRTRVFSFFFFNDTATTEIYTLSLHDALPICKILAALGSSTLIIKKCIFFIFFCVLSPVSFFFPRSEEHTSELQSQSNLVCRLLLEKKKKSSAAPVPRASTYARRQRQRARTPA